LAVSDRVSLRRLSLRGFASVAAIAAAAAGFGCDREPAGLEADVYVEAMARLTYADIQLFDEDRLDSARVAILSELDTSAEALVAFAERHGDDVAYMHAIWTRIRQRVDSLEAPPLRVAPGDSASAATPPP